MSDERSKCTEWEVARAEFLRRLESELESMPSQSTFKRLWDINKLVGDLTELDMMLMNIDIILGAEPLDWTTLLLNIERRCNGMEVVE